MKWVYLFILTIINHTFASAQDDAIQNYQFNMLAETTFLNGKRAGESGDYQRACELIVDAISIDSLNAEYYEYLAINAHKLGDLDLLNQCYNQASLIFKSDHQIYYVHGNAYQNLEQHDKAIALYNKAISLAEQENKFSGFYLYYFNRGNTHLKIEKYRQAQYDYDKALQLNDWHDASLTNRGIAKYKLKNKTGACTDWFNASNYGNLVAKEYREKYCQ